MSEFCTTEELSERLKDIFSRQKNYKGKKVFDVDVAAELGITEGNFAVMKRRNKLPLVEVTLFCHRCGLNPLNLVMKKKSC